MLKRYFLLLSILISSVSFAQNISQKWIFESIRLANDTSEKNLKPIVNGDYMLLREDGTFEYKLNSIPLSAKGNWELKNQFLTYHYTFPNDTIRSFNLSFTKYPSVINADGRQAYPFTVSYTHLTLPTKA